MAYEPLFAKGKAQAPAQGSSSGYVSLFGFKGVPEPLPIQTKKKKNELDLNAFNSAAKSGGLTTKPQPTPVQAVSSFFIEPVANSVNTLGTATAASTNYLINQFNGSSAKRQKEILDNIRKSSELKQKASNFVLSPEAKNKLNKQAAGLENINKSLISSQKSQSADINKNVDPVKVGASIANLGLTVALPGAGKIAGGVASKIPGAAGKVVGGFTEGAAFGGGFGLNSQLEKTGTKTKLEDALASTGTGAVIGGVLGGVPPLIGAGAESVINKLTGKPKLISADKLTSYEGAPDQKQVDLYKAQLQSGNPIDPIIVKKDSLGNLGIEDGKHRFEAYKQLGIKKVPIVVDSKVSSVPTRPSLDAQINSDQPLGDVTKQQIQAAVSEKTKYGQSGLKKATDTIRREVADPYNLFAREDAAYGKLTNTTKNQLVAQGRDLPTLVGNARHYGEVFNQFLKTKGRSGQSVEDVIKKYGELSPEDVQKSLDKGVMPTGAEFNNYANNKFALEVYDKSKGKLNLQSQYDIEGIRKAVADYEAKNVSAVKDLSVFKDMQDNIIDHAVASKVISPKDATAVKSAYKYYTPLSRVSPEDLVKPSVSGGIRTNVGKQNILQRLVGSDKPLDVSFTSALNKAHSDLGQSLKNRLDTELLRRHQEGAFKGDLVIDPEITRAGKELRDLHKGLVKDGKDLRSQMGKNVSQLRVQNAYTAPIRKQAVKATRNYLSKGLDDPAAIAGLKGMTDKQLLEAFQVITGDKEIDAIRETLLKKSKTGQSLIDNIERLKKEYHTTDEERQKAFEDLINVKQDKTTGKQIVSGQLYGEKFAIEVAPDFATALEKLSPGQTRDLISTIANGGANVQKTFATGAFAPVFAVIQALKNQFIMFTNAKGLSAFGARAIATAIKPDPVFLKELAMRGARPETFTQNVNDAAMTAMHIASKGSLKNRAYLVTKHPFKSADEFMHTLNKVGGILGNRQRAQVARGSYINALKKNYSKEEALNIAAYDYNEVIGNFNRVSTLAKNMEPIILYTGATQSGARSLLRAFKERPIESSAKLAAMASAFGGFGAASLASPAGQEYYKDMYDNKQSYNIDNFITWVAPWATKDKKSGKWSGIYKLAIAPDFRPLNKAINEQIYKSGQGKGIDGVMVAKAFFNTVTGGLASETGGQTDISPQEILKQNPFIKTAGVYFGKDVNTGKDIPKEDNVGTTDAGKALGKTLGLSGNQGDKLLGQTGLAGRVAKGKNGNPVETVAGNFAGQFYGTQGSNAAVSGKLDDIISSKQTTSSDITVALQKKDYNKAHQLARDYNSKIKSLESYVKSNSKTSELTDKQKSMLDKMKFPLSNGKLSQKSIDYRLKQ